MARKFWYIPWGHYRTTGQGVPPANEVWIGRHTERARLLDHLLHSDGRGAILITGARGSGKTSFVAHCLRDYQRAIHERFLIQKGGTLGIFDYAVVLFTAFVLILLEILGSGILSMFTGILERHIARDLWPPLLPLIPVLFISLLLLYPTYLGVLLVRRVRREVTAAKERNTAQTWPAGSIVLITRGLVMAALGVYSFWPMIGLILKFFGLDPCFLRESTDLLTDVGLLTAISLPPQSLYGALDIVVLLISWVLFCLFSFLEYGAMIRQTKGSRPEVDLPLRFYSLPWTVLRIWLPVLVVPVNLGFEALDLRRITRAMLVALREQFRQRFLSWTSPLANVLRLARLVAVVGAATLIGDRLFRPPGMEDAAEPQNLAGSEDPYWILKDLEEHPLRVTPEQDTLRLLPPVLARILYYNFTQPSELEQPSAVDSASSSELATSRTYKRLANFLLPTANYQGVEFRVYHLCLVLIILWSSEVLLRRAGLLPYRRVLEDIDRHLESLDARVKVEQREPSWTAKLSDLTISTLGGGRVSDRDVEDPRAVEQAMLSTLERLRRTRTLVVPATDGAGLWLPTPEVTFVFDELDKLRSPFTPEGGPSDGGGRSRSVAIHRLLAEMKNLLSAAPARFIFVGGRDLRDEWLADGTARNPLLTNIF
ncbi:MAG TPA: hypothetical protein PLA94_19295, partial [Myxococcota bacterium]|nr:hypothetical protein [Myxococcota bacterium]